MYGLHGDDPAPVRRLLAGEPPIALTLGRVSTFPPTDRHDFEVLKVDVDSPDLQRLHAKLARLPHTDTHPDYLPHATIAYLKPGRAAKYTGHDFAETEATCPTVVFSSRTKQRTEIPLAPLAANYADDPNGYDGARVEELLQGARRSAVAVLGSISAEAVKRLVDEYVPVNSAAEPDEKVNRTPLSRSSKASKPARFVKQKRLFTDDERGRLTDVLAALTGMAELSGRARVGLRMEQAERHYAVAPKTRKNSADYSNGHSNSAVSRFGEPPAFSKHIDVSKFCMEGENKGKPGVCPAGGGEAPDTNQPDPGYEQLTHSQVQESRQQATTDLKAHFPTDPETLKRTLFVQISDEEGIPSEGYDFRGEEFDRPEVFHVAGVLPDGTHVVVVKKGKDPVKVAKYLKGQISDSSVAPLLKADTAEMYTAIDAPEKQYHARDRYGAEAVIAAKPINDVYSVVRDAAGESWVLPTAKLEAEHPKFKARAEALKKQKDRRVAEARSKIDPEQGRQVLDILKKSGTPVGEDDLALSIGMRMKKTYQQAKDLIYNLNVAGDIDRKFSGLKVVYAVAPRRAASFSDTPTSALAPAGSGRFSDTPTDFDAFADFPQHPLAPQAAYDYFRGLVPIPGITDPGQWGADLHRAAFTLAATTEEAVLASVHDTITQILATGQNTGPQAVQQVLDAAGVSPRNPQYADMVTRTNVMGALNQGWEEAKAAPEVQAYFPVWRFIGPGPFDPRSRPLHAVHVGKYFPNTVSFVEVRDSLYGGKFSGFNCRHSGNLVDKHEWQALQEAGTRVTRFSDVTRMCQTGVNEGKPGPCPDTSSAAAQPSHPAAQDAQPSPAAVRDAQPSSPGTSDVKPSPIGARDAYVQALEKHGHEHAAWTKRDSDRTDLKDKVSAARGLASEYAAVTAADTALHAITTDVSYGLKPADPAAATQAVAAIRAVYGKQQQDTLAALRDAGATAADVAPLEKVLSKATPKLDKAQAAYVAQVEKTAAAQAVHAGIEADEPEEPDNVLFDETPYEHPDEPEEPDAPEEPTRTVTAASGNLLELSLADFDADDYDTPEEYQADQQRLADYNAALKEHEDKTLPAYEAAHAAWETTTEKLDADREKAETKHDDGQEKAASAWEKEHTKWEGRLEKAEAKNTVEQDKVQERYDDLETLYTELHDDFDTAAEAVETAVTERADAEEAADDEPEEPDEPEAPEEPDEPEAPDEEEPDEADADEPDDEEDPAQPTATQHAETAPVPEIKQRRNWLCGPIVLLASAERYGIDTDEDALRALLGTSPEDGTPPEALLAGARAIGLDADGREGWTTPQLERALIRGWSVLACVQWIADDTVVPASLDAGHWITFTGRGPGGIECMDPDSGTTVKLGRAELARIWIDQDAEGRTYRHFGIVVKGLRP